MEALSNINSISVNGKLFYLRQYSFIDGTVVINDSTILLRINDHKIYDVSNNIIDSISDDAAEDEIVSQLSSILDGTTLDEIDQSQETQAVF